MRRLLTFLMGWSTLVVLGQGELHHWEVASRDPDRVILTWEGDPATSQSVTWRTRSDVRSGFAEIAPALGEPTFDQEAVRVEAVTTALTLSPDAENARAPVHYHTARFEGLRPDTLYAYRVGDGASNWSEWFQFRTARRGFAPFSFLYVGDAQNGLLSHWSRLMRSAFVEEPRARFIIHAGDLVNNAHRDVQWAEWFKGVGWMHGMTPAIAVPGNHEYQAFGKEERLLSIQWRPQFAFPVDEELPEELRETVYCTDFQGVRILALNSIENMEAQVDWIRRRLSDNPNRWTIATFHYPLFSSANDRDSPELRAAWLPVFDEFNVDLVLQGHDHTYARGHTTPGDGDGDGAEVRTVYVNSVSGQKMYSMSEDGWDDYSSARAKLMRWAENTQLFQVLHVTYGEVRYRAHTATGELYDAFVLEKDDDGVKRLREDPVTALPLRTRENTLGKEEAE